MALGDYRRVVPQPNNHCRAEGLMVHAIPAHLARMLLVVSRTITAIGVSKTMELELVAWKASNQERVYRFGDPTTASINAETYN